MVSLAQVEIGNLACTFCGDQRDSTGKETGRESMATSAKSEPRESMGARDGRRGSVEASEAALADPSIFASRGGLGDL
jgi:hypothetical protein